MTKTRTTFWALRYEDTGEYWYTDWEAPMLFARREDARQIGRGLYPRPRVVKIEVNLIPRVN
jgi:hypothetical protein